jgi:hypothetical protein
MALSTYEELQTELASWMHRGNLTSVIPTCIALCEADFNRRLRIAVMEVRSAAEFDEGYENLPSDFLELREVKVNTSPVCSLQYMTPAQMTEFYPSLTSGNPQFYTLVDSQIRMNRIPTSEVEIAYYTRIPALSDDAPTNWMLTNHPDVYLYGALTYLEPHIKNDKRLPMWKQLYEASINQVKDADRQARWSGASLQMRVS